MGKSVMAESAALLGDTPIESVTPTDVATYTPRETAAAKSLIMDADTTEEVITPNRPMIGIPTSGMGSPNYDDLAKRIARGEELYAVHNTSEITIALPWDMVLMPDDLKPEFKKYLTEKYIMYGQQKLIDTGAIMIAIFVDNHTVNFLENFMAEKQIPSLVSVQQGRESFIRSRFVVRPDEKVVCTAEQIKSLEKYEKVKHVTDTDGEDGKKKESSALGFLYFDQITSDKELRKIGRSFVTYNDVIKGGVVVGADALIQKTKRNRGNFKRA